MILEKNLVGRSKARRILAYFEDAKRISLDFKYVELMNPSFADEIFRVYRRLHPEKQIVFINASDQVAAMIRKALNDATGPG